LKAGYSGSFPSFTLILKLRRGLKDSILLAYN